MPLKKRIFLIAAALVVIALVIALIIITVSKNIGNESDQQSETAADTIETEAMQVSLVRHLSFPELTVYEAEGYLSVSEFLEILNTLYNEDYVLVDIYSLADTDADGKMSLKKTIEVPEGKNPLIISQRDVSYPISKQNSWFAKRLVVDSDGYIRNEYVGEDGNSVIGDYDVIPLVESFIREHPDFSYNGAKGIIGLTGYNGILGYRTSSYLASDDINPYGVFDTEYEIQNARGVIDVLANGGWHYASNGFQNISYGSEYSLVEADANAWEEQVGSLVGDTDLIILPKKTDIGSWAPYAADNAKYVLLSSLGFRYFMINDTETPGFLQVESSYLRQAITEIDTMADFLNFEIAVSND